MMNLLYTTLYLVATLTPGIPINSIEMNKTIKITDTFQTKQFCGEDCKKTENTAAFKPIYEKAIKNNKYPCGFSIVNRR